MSQEAPVDVMVWLRAFRYRTINLLLGSVALLGTAGLLYMLAYRFGHGVGLSFALIVYLLSYLLVLILFCVRRIPDTWRALGFLALLYGFSVFSFANGWLGSSARTFLLLLIALSAILVGPRAGAIAAVLSLVTYAAFGLAYHRGWLTYPPAPAYSTLPYIIIEGLGFAMAVGMTGIALWFMRDGLAAASRATQEARAARAKLAEHAEDLDTANQLLAERTARLEATNQELESFTYSVSHDLLAPVRAMEGFSRALLEDYGPQLPRDAQDYLRRIGTSAHKMRELINGLLSLSRLGRQALRLRTVDPAGLARQVWEELAEERAGRLVDLLLDELPPCQADPTLLKQVFANLLGNALKYTRQQDWAFIKVGSQEMDGVPAYFVRDNGVGFDMTYADRLFAVFQRVHSAEEYEGSGVGLAIVQRIVHRHGGRVWAEGATDQGATFYFTLGESSGG